MVSTLLPALRHVSDQWLTAKRTREKRFSLGFFDETYLTRLPVAVVRYHGAIVAFANVWPSGDGEELSVDLMRYADAAPTGVVDFLLCELMLWGQSAGFQWYDLGMAPLSGLANRRFAPVWNRIGAMMYRRGEALYQFQGLRRFKEKFDPIWEPRYLASSGRGSTVAVLGSVATLIAGGTVGAWRR